MNICMRSAKICCNLYRKQLYKKQPHLRNKPIVFFHVADYAESYDIDDNIIVVRSSINRSTMQSSDIVRPAIPYEDWKGPIQEKKSIGFCGFPHTHPIRTENLNELHCQMKSNLTDIIHNISFIIIDEKSREITLDLVRLLWMSCYRNNRSLCRKKFCEILHRNIFSFCPRGRGNYSIRFYETLRAGRIQ